MRFVTWRSLLALVLVVLIAGCSEKPRPELKNAAVGGLAGGAAGAGIGALVGSLIANGDVAMSAMLGGGIGLASGIAIGIAYKAISDGNEYSSNMNKIRKSEIEILDNYQTIGQIRADLDNSARQMEPDPASQEHLYTGPSLGVYNR